MKAGKRAMILAAGKGTRMGDLSAHTPKPLVPVAGRSMLDRILDHLKAAGVGPVVVNMHHLADKLEAHLAGDVAAGYVQLSDERAALLETGGGVKKALPLLGPAPFFVINGDALWVDEGPSNLRRMQHLFDDQVMDVLLLLTPRTEALGYEGVGDFTGGADTEIFPLAFRGNLPGAPYVFAGVQIVRPEMYDSTPAGAWSNVEIFKRAAAAGRLFGTVIEGYWMHIGTKGAIQEAEQKLAKLGVL